MPTLAAFINRGNNLAALALLAAVALGGALEIAYEGSPLGAFDEVAILVIAAVGLVWYRANLFARSMLPIFLLAGAFVLKVIAIVIEEADDKADDFAVVAVLLVSVIVSSVIYYRARAAVGPSRASLDQAGEPVP